MSSPRVLVTTSWDDGHVLDERLAATLAEYGVKGTFYVAPRSAELGTSDRLSRNALRRLQTNFEIGSHTLSHPHLTTLPDESARQEIRAGKQELEDAVGAPVNSFCYPYGAYSPAHAAMTEELGIRAARTTKRFSVHLPLRPLEMETTSHASRYRTDALRILLREPRPLRARAIWKDWDVLARILFEEAQAGGNVFHLWGHSWEIDAHDDWLRLRAFLKWIVDHENVDFVTNGELAELARANSLQSK